MSVPAGNPAGSGQTPGEGLRGVPGEPESRGVTSQTWLGLGAQGLLRGWVCRGWWEVRLGRGRWVVGEHRFGTLGV